MSALPQPIPRIMPTVDEMNTMLQIAQLLCKSGYYRDVTTPEQAFAKILRGWGLGITPAESLEAINTISGKLALTANLMATLIQRAGYRWVIELDDTHCKLEIYDRSAQHIGTSSFSVDDAKKAGLNSATWQKFPRNLLFARAISNAAKWYCPDAFGGAPVYTPDELGAEVNEEGEIIAMPSAPIANAIQMPDAPHLATRQTRLHLSELLAEYYGDEPLILKNKHHLKSTRAGHWLIRFATGFKATGSSEVPEECAVALCAMVEKRIADLATAPPAMPKSMSADEGIPAVESAGE